ncbi:ABC transporter ATP-binding protein [Oscillatoria sp. CS-180]|uniref:ABC transporter ATP-binding protein n=1 Tax=Oscillatoria sp. CS-180 TaxID=3021720 RepID=UPI00232F782F|nr:ABC transporter ATP-binding protein [Oscillatoria sp. CS-180]MDB9526125.1 ABC transporter ATP-binding protein [Oscillatoria sp. CS-180]
MAQVVLENLYKTFVKQGNSQPVDVANSPQVDSAVLRRICLTVQDGEFMVLVGPSGCGKSTLLRLISGLEEITAGTIRVGEQRVNELPPKQRDIAMVFQSYALYPHLTVYDNLSFGLRRMGASSQVLPRRTDGKTSPSVMMDANQELQQALLKRTRWQTLLAGATRRFPKKLCYLSAADKLIDQRVRSVAHMLQIDELLDRLPRQLSGGQKQRVALGRAIARNPQVFLMDEPLSNLDAKLRTETRAQIVNLQRQLGITTIYVTHDQVEAMTMGDRIAVMNQGQIQQVATPLELYRQPANRFVASFIGSPPMNFLPVQVSAPLLVHHHHFRLTLSGDWETTLAAYDGETVTLGIRPEHFSLSSPAPKNLQVTVRRIEALGSETYLAVQFGDDLLQVRVEPDRPFSIGEELWLAIAPDKVHLFDSRSEAALNRVQV